MVLYSKKIPLSFDSQRELSFSPDESRSLPADKCPDSSCEYIFSLPDNRASHPGLPEKEWLEYSRAGLSRKCPGSADIHGSSDTNTGGDVYMAALNAAIRPIFLRRVSRVFVRAQYGKEETDISRRRYRGRGIFRQGAYGYGRTARSTYRNAYFFPPQNIRAGGSYPQDRVDISMLIRGDLSLCIHLKSASDQRYSHR